MPTQVLFARIGWMTNYNGPNQADDERPQGDGKYNADNIGNEAYNFKDVRGKIYGYFQPQMAASSIALERIRPGFSGSSLEGVTVIFIATHPKEGGQRIVGWYANAKVSRHPQEDVGDERMGFNYFITAKATDAVLLPTKSRLQLKLSGKGGFGQANVRYLYESDTPLVLPWANEALAFINSYDAGNLMGNPLLESTQDVEQLMETVLDKAAGYESNSKIRAAIENRAMDVASAYFKKNWTVEDVHKYRSYDLQCKSGPNELYVEVKGTRGLGDSIILTPKEVEFARKNSAKCALAVVDSIKVSRSKRKPKATGGHLRTIHNWNPDEHELKAAAYVCKLNAVKAVSAGKG